MLVCTSILFYWTQGLGGGVDATTFRKFDRPPIKSFELIEFKIKIYEFRTFGSEKKRKAWLNPPPPDHPEIKKGRVQ